MKFAICARENGIIGEFMGHSFQTWVVFQRQII